MRPTLTAKGEKKVRKALKLLPYRIIGHFKQNDELGFFIFYFFSPQTDP